MKAPTRGKCKPIKGAIYHKTLATQSWQCHRALALRVYIVAPSYGNFYYSEIRQNVGY